MKSHRCPCWLVWLNRRRFLVDLVVSESTQEIHPCLELSKYIFGVLDLRLSSPETLFRAHAGKERGSCQFSEGR